MDASVKCYIHTRTFLHKSNQKILNQKIHYNFQKSNSEFINKKRLNFEVNPIQFNLWMSFPPLTILHQQVL